MISDEPTPNAAAIGQPEERSPRPKPRTGAEIAIDLQELGLTGIWKDRLEAADPESFSRQLRQMVERGVAMSETPWWQDTTKP